MRRRELSPCFIFSSSIPTYISYLVKSRSSVCFFDLVGLLEQTFDFPNSTSFLQASCKPPFPFRMDKTSLYLVYEPEESIAVDLE